MTLSVCCIYVYNEHISSDVLSNFFKLKASWGFSGLQTSLPVITCAHLNVVILEIMQNTDPNQTD